jgi:hypothetical protein
MISQPLIAWGQGAVTLPKEWRDQFPTKHFMALETADGLLIKPILDIEYYEEGEGHFGLKFPMGIDAEELRVKLTKAEAKMRKSKKKSAR